MQKLLLGLLLAAGLLTQCRRADPNPDSPEAQLPPATQTGADTFGCLLNGQAWTPSGYNGTSNYAVTFDPTFQGGSLDIRAYRYLNDRLGRYKQQIILGGDGINQVGSYTLASTGSQGAFFFGRTTAGSCSRSPGNPDTYTHGTLTITRLDRAAGIISGTFEFALAQSGCDTLKVTQGRFDYKL